MPETLNPPEEASEPQVIPIQDLEGHSGFQELPPNQKIEALNAWRDHNLGVLGENLDEQTRNLVDVEVARRKHQYRKELNEGEEGFLADQRRAEYLSDLKNDPMTRGYASEIQDLDAEFASRMQLLNDEEEFDAETAAQLQNEFSEKYNEVFSRMTGEAEKSGELFQLGSQLWQDIGDMRSMLERQGRDPEEIDQRINTLYNRYQQNVARIAESIGIEPRRAGEITQELIAQNREWRDDEDQRVLPSGTLMVNPRLLWREDEYRRAINESDATEDQKERAFRNIDRLKKQAAPAMARGLRATRDYVQWEKKQDLDKYEDMGEMLTAYFKDRGRFRSFMANTSGILAKGLNDVAAQFFGLGAFLRGDEEIMEALADPDGVYAGTQQAINQSLLNQGRSQLTIDVGAGGVSLLPSVAAGGVGSYLKPITGGIGKWAAGSGLGKFGSTMMSRVLVRGRGQGSFAARHLRPLKSKVLEKAASQAGLGGAGAGAFMQSFGGVYPEAVAKYKELGLSTDEAMDAAMMPSLASGLGTALLTIGFGRTGVEAIFKQGSGQSIRDIVATVGKHKFAAAVRSEPFKRMVKDVAKDVGGNFTSEAFEEGWDQLAQGLIASARFDPDKSLPDIIHEAMYAGGIGGILGGTVGNIRTAGEAAFLEGRALDVTQSPEIQERQAMINAMKAEGVLDPELLDAAQEKLNQQTSQLADQELDEAAKDLETETAESENTLVTLPDGKRVPINEAERLRQAAYLNSLNEDIDEGTRNREANLVDQLDEAIAIAGGAVDRNPEISEEDAEGVARAAGYNAAVNELQRLEEKGLSNEADVLRARELRRQIEDYEQANQDAPSLPFDEIRMTPERMEDRIAEINQEIRDLDDDPFGLTEEEEERRAELVAEREDLTQQLENQTNEEGDQDNAGNEEDTTETNEVPEGEESSEETSTDAEGSEAGPVSTEADARTRQDQVDEIEAREQGNLTVRELAELRARKKGITRENYIKNITTDRRRDIKKQISDEILTQTVEEFPDPNPSDPDYKEKLAAAGKARLQRGKELRAERASDEEVDRIIREQVEREIEEAGSVEEAVIQAEMSNIEDAAASMRDKRGNHPMVRQMRKRIALGQAVRPEVVQDMLRIDPKALDDIKAEADQSNIEVSDATYTNGRRTLTRIVSVDGKAYWITGTTKRKGKGIIQSENVFKIEPGDGTPALPETHFKAKEENGKLTLKRAINIAKKSLVEPIPQSEVDQSVSELRRQVKALETAETTESTTEETTEEPPKRTFKVSRVQWTTREDLINSERWSKSGKGKPGKGVIRVWGPPLEDIKINPESKWATNEELQTGLKKNLGSVAQGGHSLMDKTKDRRTTPHDRFYMKGGKFFIKPAGAKEFRAANIEETNKLAYAVSLKRSRPTTQMRPLLEEKGDIIDDILHHGKVRTKAAAMEQSNWNDIKDEYDGWGEIEANVPRGYWRNQVFSENGFLPSDTIGNIQSGGGQERASTRWDDLTVSEFWAEVANAFRARINAESGDATNDLEVRQEGQQQQRENFDEATDPDSAENLADLEEGNGDLIYGANLRVNDVVFIDGERFKVTEVDLENETVTLKDGTKFGIQTIGEREVIFVEDVQPDPGNFPNNEENEFQNIFQRQQEKRAEEERKFRETIKEVGDADGVQMTNPKQPGWTLIVTRDLQETGKWRATRFDEDGRPFGHTTYDTRDDAIGDHMGQWVGHGPPHSHNYELVEARTLGPRSKDEPELTPDNRIKFTQEAYDNFLDNYWRGIEASVSNDPKQQVNADKVAKESGEVLGPDVTPKEARQGKRPAEAEARINEWKAQIDKDFAELQSENFRKGWIISLFDSTGEWSQPFRDAGYSVAQIDLALKGGGFGWEMDIMDVTPQWLMEESGLLEDNGVWGIMAACPCTALSKVGAKHRKTLHDVRTPESIEHFKRVFGERAAAEYDTMLDYSRAMVEHTLGLIEFIKPDGFWAIENPVGRMKTVTSIPVQALQFEPHNYGDPFTKRTQIFGNFNPNLPMANVNPTGGSWVEKFSGTQGGDVKKGGKPVATRSDTFEGFAHAFYMGQREIVSPWETAEGIEEIIENAGDRIQELYEFHAVEGRELKIEGEYQQDLGKLADELGVPVDQVEAAAVELDQIIREAAFNARREGEVTTEEQSQTPRLSESGMETQGDLLANQQEDLSLVGEETTDTEFTPPDNRTDLERDLESGQEQIFGRDFSEIQRMQQGGSSGRPIITPSQQEQKAQIERDIERLKIPVAVETAETLGIELPDSYVREGDTFVHKEAGQEQLPGTGPGTEGENRNGFGQTFLPNGPRAKRAQQLLEENPVEYAYRRIQDFIVRESDGVNRKRIKEYFKNDPSLPIPDVSFEAAVDQAVEQLIADGKAYYVGKSDKSRLQLAFYDPAGPVPEDYQRPDIEEKRPEGFPEPPENFLDFGVWTLMFGGSPKERFTLWDQIRNNPDATNLEIQQLFGPSYAGSGGRLIVKPVSKTQDGSVTETKFVFGGEENPNRVEISGDDLANKIRELLGMPPAIDIAAAAEAAGYEVNFAGVIKNPETEMLFENKRKKNPYSVRLEYAEIDGKVHWGYMTNNGGGVAPSIDKNIADSIEEARATVARIAYPYMENATKADKAKLAELTGQEPETETESAQEPETVSEPQIRTLDDEGRFEAIFLPDEVDGDGNPVNVMEWKEEGKFILLRGLYRGSDRDQLTGTQMLQWLKNRYPDKTIEAIDVQPGAEGFWDKMEERGLISKWFEDETKPEARPPASTSKTPETKETENKARAKHIEDNPEQAAEQRAEALDPESNHLIFESEVGNDVAFVSNGSKDGDGILRKIARDRELEITEVPDGDYAGRTAIVLNTSEYYQAGYIREAIGKAGNWKTPTPQSHKTRRNGPDDPVYGSPGPPRGTSPASVDPPLNVVERPNTKPIDVTKVIDAIAAMMASVGNKTAIRVGNLKSPVNVGEFDPHSRVARIRVANNIWKATHEAGHAIEEEVNGGTGAWGTHPGITLRALGDLEDLGIDLYPTAIYNPPAAGYESEGFAEFLKLYVTQGASVAEARAPDFYDFFQNHFLPTQPGFAEALKTARRIAKRYDDQGALNRNKQNMVDENAAKTRYEKWRKNTDLVEQWVDMMAPISRFVDQANGELAKQGLPPLQPDEDPYFYASVRRLSHDAIAEKMINVGMVDILGTRVGMSLEEAVRPVKQTAGKGWKDKMENFMIYLWAKRTKALAQYGIIQSIDDDGNLTTRVIEPRDSGMAEADADKIIQELESPEFMQAASNVYEWQEGLLNYMAQSSPDFAQTVDNIRTANMALTGESHGFYIPLSREFDAINARAIATAGEKGSSPVRRLKGSGRRIKNPIESMMAQASAIVKKSHEKHTLDLLIDMVENIPGMGGMMAPVRRSTKPLAEITYEQMLTKVTNAVERAGGSADVDVQGVPNDFLDQVFTFFGPATQPGPNEPPVIPIFRDGKTQWYEVDPQIWRAISGMEVYRFNNLLARTFLQAPAAAFRLGTTGLRASFSLVTNPLRDLRTLLINSQAHANTPTMIASFTKSWWQLFLYSLSGGKTTGGGTVDPFVELFENMGGAMSQQLRQDTAHVKRAGRVFFKGRLVRTLDPRNVFDWLRGVLQFPETAARVTEMKQLAKDIGWDGTSPITENQMLRLMLAAKQVTTDFTQAGEMARAWNQAVPFLNASIQGPNAHIRAWKRNRGKFILRGLQGTMLALGLWFRYKDEDWWREMPAQQRYAYTWIPYTNPLTGNPELLRIPRAFEADGIFMAAFTAMFEGWYRKDPSQAGEWIGQFIKNSVPGTDYPGIPIPIPTPVLLEEVIEQAWNKDFFFDQPIIPRGEQDMFRSEQYSPYTSRVAVKVGEMFNLSPRRIDHAIRGIFGGFGGDVAGGLDILFGEVPGRIDRQFEPADVPVFGGLLGRRGGQSSLQSRSIDKFYDQMEWSHQLQRSARLDETEDQRQIRLQMQDAHRAMVGLGEIQRNLTNTADIRALQDMKVEIARSAVEDFESNAINRKQYSRWKKEVEKLTGK